MITWRRIGLKDYVFPDIKEYTKEYLKNINNIPVDVKLNKITECANNAENHKFDISEVPALGKEFTSFVESSYNSGISIYLPQNIKLKSPIRLEFNMDDKNPTVVDHNIIIAEPNSEVTIVIDYNSDNKTKTFHNGFTKVYAKEDSIVNIVKIQRINDHSYNFDSNIALVKERAIVNWISIELGSSISGSNYSSILQDMASESNLHSIYLGDGTRKMDLGYTMIHKGPKSLSTIETKGVLKDKSKKIFRGDLNFKRGARHSKGSEEEYVILLDPTVKSDSIPALLCDEDDVEGDHAVSAGKIDESKLFYLMSRGLSEKESKKLIVEASFKPIIEKIPYEDLQKVISHEVERRLING
ncbi:Fe-S cluster assembly protein SufD [Wansuia hejianensis]|uniref:Fe-S cluster assembly protein SufD n=1 Tax=Wansuia hejianensis TaxID=2763667 RepID=A0A926IL01_9FIRM|nr:Fe-S cluster assembly protein SufD [Wansuia hejianensis]MBC8589619.1 Fe-S cluster assembly protein SufD [Wansuia hejianensis]